LSFAARVKGRRQLLRGPLTRYRLVSRKASTSALPSVRAIFERVLNTAEAAYGPDHPNVARSLNNLALVLKDLGELAQAQAILERALKIDEAAYGPNHPEVATELDNLARILSDLGELTTARTLLEHALAIRRQALGAEQTKTKSVESNLASLVEELVRTEKKDHNRTASR
jgi:tetratricopeptide (TPR) repeat protein